MEIKKGQIFKDKDKRQRGRHVWVNRIEGLYAYCIACRPNGLIRKGERETRISLNNLRTRFTLVSDAN